MISYHGRQLRLNTSSNHFYGKDRRSCLILVLVSCSVFNFLSHVSTSRSEFNPYEVATLKLSFFSSSSMASLIL